MWYCIDCGKEMKSCFEICPHCGYNQQEYINCGTGTVEPKKERVIKREKKVKEPMFTEEQAFMMHIHPDDKTYRDIMRMNILSKDYRRK